VNVARSGDRIASRLLGAGVIRRHHSHRCRRLIPTRTGGAQLGDAEIQQFYRPGGCHQDVAVLDVAVYDQVAVSVRHGRADFLTQLEALFIRQPASVAVLPDRLAFDVLHHKVRQAFFGRTAVQEPRYVGVIQVGEYLALAQEPPDDEFGIHPGPDQLNSNPFAELIVGPRAQVDRAHSSAPDFAYDLVGANPAPDRLIGRWRLQSDGRRLISGRFDKRRRAVVRCQ